MASPLNNPWVSGGLGAGVVLYLGVSMTPEAWKQPVRNFFTGEVRREGGKEPELKIGTEKVFRAVTRSGLDRWELIVSEDRAEGQRKLFREVTKGQKEAPVAPSAVPELPEGSGLLAVWVDGDQRVAVMTDGMVREGEPWGAFLVQSVTPDAVTLRHSAGERVIRLGEIRTTKAGVKVAASPPADKKPAEGSPEAQLQKVLDMQKSMDPSKLLQGFPQKILDSFMGTPKKAVEP